MRKVCLFLFSVVLSLFPARAEAQTDNFIAQGSTSPYLTLGRALTWGGQGLGTVGQNFIFHPVDPNQGFCVFVYNNNPTNSHTFSVTVAQTGDPAIQNYQGFTSHWTSVPTSTSFPATVAAATLVGINYKTTASAGIVISFTGNATAAGSPDTADIFTVQTSQSSCGSLPTNAVQGPFDSSSTITNAQLFPVLVGGSTTPNATGPIYPIAVGTQGPGGLLMDSSSCCSTVGTGYNSPGNYNEWRGIRIGGVQANGVLDVFPFTTWGTKGFVSGVAKNLWESACDYNNIGPTVVPCWTASGKLVNPAAGAVILSQFLTNTSGVNTQYKSATVSCSVACEMIIARQTSAGVGCTAIGAVNISVGANIGGPAPNAQDLVQNNCVTTAPTLGNTAWDLQLGAGVPFTVDMSGWSNFHNATNGAGIAIEVVGTITGTASAQISWAEN